MSDFNLTHHFLIAMPAMQEGFFAGTLTYVCEHNENGALGVVVNPPVSLTLGELFGQINIPLHQPKLVKMPVHFGGPVQTERGFVLHDTPGNWESTLRINDKLALTTSRDILEAMGVGRGPRNMIVTLGYAGWDQGQLEHEITENTWLTVPVSTHTPRIRFRHQTHRHRHRQYPAAPRQPADHHRRRKDRGALCGDRGAAD